MPDPRPKCPDCGIKGIEHITSTPSEKQHGTGNQWFDVAHCDECGHVYGVFVKYTIKPMPKMGPFGS
jgi:uncharacterized Zn finger protein